MPDFDPERFVNTTIYAFDFQFMIGDVKDFLDFSENNIDWQHHRELQAIAHQRDLDEYPIDYREHLEENANHRFLVSLPLRIRYAAVLALTTSVEWSVRYLNMMAFVAVPEKRDRTNQTVRVLRELSARTHLASNSTIDDYEAVVNVRNCIAHSAGLLETYQFKDTLPGSVARLKGFSLANWQFFGDQVCIERGALDQYIYQMGKLVVDLHRSMHEKGLMQP